MGRDDVLLCEGLLNIFLKPNATRHVVTYKKSQIVRSTGSLASRAAYKDTYIDFGSFKETIEIEHSEQLTSSGPGGPKTLNSVNPSLLEPAFNSQG